MNKCLKPLPSLDEFVLDVFFQPMVVDVYGGERLSFLAIAERTFWCCHPKTHLGLCCDILGLKFDPQFLTSYFLPRHAWIIEAHLAIFSKRSSSFQGFSAKGAPTSTRSTCGDEITQQKPICKAIYNIYRGHNSIYHNRRGPSSVSLVSFLYNFQRF